MPQLHVHTRAAFPAVLQWQVVSFMRVQWPFIFVGENRFSKESYPALLHPVHFTVSEDEVLMSHAELLRLNLPHAGSTYKVYGLGNVFTYPPYRGEGYGRQVVQAATRYILDSDVDLGILFCNTRLERLYQGSGWETLEGASTRIGSPDEYTVDHDLRMMVFVSDKGKRARQAFASEPLYIESAW